MQDKIQGMLTSKYLLAVLFTLASGGAAHAAGGALPGLVQDMGTSLLVAGVLAVIFARLKIPSIAAFILAGILIGPQVMSQVTDPVNIESISQIGFVLLLFVIGLEIDVRSLFGGSRNILIAGAIQYPVTLFFGLLAAKLMIIVGLGGLFEGMPLAPFYVGVAIAGSSSLLVVKLFQEHFELDTHPGRIALAMLIFQDIWAIVITILQPSLANPDLKAIFFSFVGIGVLVLIAALLARIIVARALVWIAKVPELILLGAVSWCFAITVVGTNIDTVTKLVGFNLHMNVSAGMAALIAGATIASLPFSTEIITKVGLVKDFFITLFFVGLGVSMPALDGWSVPLLALIVGILAIVARQLVFFPLFYFLGVDQRSAQVSSIRLSQISEFGLVIAYLGLEMGHINFELASVIILAFVFTAVLTTPLFEQAYKIYDHLKGILSKLGFKEPLVDDEDASEEVQLAILGLHRDASSLLHELSEVSPEILGKTTVVDFNVALHSKVRAMGVHVEYGDISNHETLIHAGVDRAKVILCTISDDLLRGITNKDLVRSLRHINPNAVIISNAIDMRAYEQVRSAGADYVYMARLEVARALVDAVQCALGGSIERHREETDALHGVLSERREVIS
ncbi:MAG: cation:proton antiporter [Paracoccaceae bacterium]|nr:cation:proton antiporter [Paracoccaceae bacterium]